MQAAKTLGVRQHTGELGDGDPRRVGGDGGVFGQDALEGPQHLGLERGVFGDRLDDQGDVGVGQPPLGVGHGADARHHRVGVFGDATLLVQLRGGAPDGGQGAVEHRLPDVHQAHGVTRLGAELGDAVAHGAGADDRDS